MRTPTNSKHGARPATTLPAGRSARTAGPQGDERELFERHHEQLVRLLERTARASREEAEDACQFAWLQLFRYQPERITIVGWLYVVARRQLISARRRAQRSRVDVELVEDQPDGAADLLDALEARELIELMPSLKPQQRLVLWLQLEGYSYAEICRLTDKTYSWVNRHVSEGRAALRKLASG